MLTVLVIEGIKNYYRIKINKDYNYIKKSKNKVTKS